MVSTQSFQRGDLVRVKNDIRLNKYDKLLNGEEYVVNETGLHDFVYLELGHEVVTTRAQYLELIHRPEIKKESTIGEMLNWSSKAVLYLAVFTVYFSLIGSYLMVMWIYWPYSISILILTSSVLYCYYRYWKHYKNE